MVEAGAILLDAKQITIACHMNPDPDAIGSMLGLANYLRGRGKEVVCSFGNDPFELPRWAHDLPGGDQIVPPKNVAKAPEVLVTCDAASLDRLGSLVGRVDKAATVIWIDHHMSNDVTSTVSLVDPHASSTCEMVHRLITAMGGPLDPAIATCLYAGLVTDTGRFQYQAVTPATLRLAADLREQDFEHTRIVQSLYDDNSVPYLHVLGAAMQRATYEPEADLVWTYLTRADLENGKVHPAEMDDLIDVLRTARESDVAALIKQQQDGRFKVSMRSRGAHDVSKVAQSYGGGGHRLASGFTSPFGMAKTVRALCEAIPQYPLAS